MRKKSSKRTEDELCVPTFRPHSSYSLLLHLYISTTPVTTCLQLQMQLYFTCFHHKAYIFQPVLQLRSHINFPFFYLHLKTPPAGPAARIWPNCSGARHKIVKKQAGFTQPILSSIEEEKRTRFWQLKITTIRN